MKFKRGDVFNYKGSINGYPHNSVRIIGVEKENIFKKCTTYTLNNTIVYTEDELLKDYEPSLKTKLNYLISL